MYAPGRHLRPVSAPTTVADAIEERSPRGVMALAGATRLCNVPGQI
jgi:hypothetical protein